MWVDNNGRIEEVSIRSVMAGVLFIAAPIALGVLTRPLWGFILFGLEVIPSGIWALGQVTVEEIRENSAAYGRRYREAWRLAAKVIGGSVALTLIFVAGIHRWDWGLTVIPVIGVVVGLSEVRSAKRLGEQEQLRKLADELSEEELREYFRHYGA